MITENPRGGEGLVSAFDCEIETDAQFKRIIGALQDSTVGLG
jgi:hypothetical protein